jgi:hypothetical protein
VKIDAQNYTHSANSSGSTRYDWIYVAVSASLAANPIADMSTTGTIVVSRSTSSSTDNGTPPTYGYCIAVVTLANGFASVTNGNIADKRVQTGGTAKSLVAGTSVAGIYNPYKFSVYRAAALNSPVSVTAMVAFDTKNFDTSSNVDVVTNKGRFTAPIAGFYHFDANVEIASTSTSIFIVLLFKNGTQVGRGSDLRVASSNKGGNVSATLQLAAGDYIEVGLFTDTAQPLDVTNNGNNTFSGFLVSAT